MLRVVCDANVLVSGFVAPMGNPHTILIAWRQQKFILIASHEIIREVIHALGRPFFREKRGITDQHIRAVRELLEHDALLVSIGTPPRVVPNDPTDDHIIACAVNGQADYVVTGDQDLLMLKNYQEIPIISPHEFCIALRETGAR